jgi:Domain of unknown function (DUF3400)
MLSKFSSHVRGTCEIAAFPHCVGTTADYIVVEIAKHKLGENWMAEYVAKANNGGIERVLL